jgi:HAE1 family hydrophobic/amphiphilic exporter-1
MTARIVSDQSVFIEEAVHSIETHLVEGSILASVIIFFFLANIRTTLIAAIAIPTSIISTFGLMAAMGYTLNRITMLALTLMVGIVIDDAIIVLEHLPLHGREGPSPTEAAPRARARSAAVMATTLSLWRSSFSRLHGRHCRPLHVLIRFDGGAVAVLVSFTLMMPVRIVKPPEKKAAATIRRTPFLPGPWTPPTRPC